MNIIVGEVKSNIESGLQTKLESAGSISYVQDLDGLTKEQYKSCEILAINPDIVGWEITNKTLDKFVTLKAIFTVTTSLSMLDLDYCEKRNIKVQNTSNYSTQAVAEYAIWMMLSLARKLPIIMNHQHKDGYYNELFLQDEIKGKKAGIIGYGDIGKEIADLCASLGMDILVTSPNSKSKHYSNVSLNELLTKSDYVFPCYKNDKSTIGLLDKAKFKQGASVISIISAKFISVDYLRDNIEKGILKGLAYEADEMDKSGYNIFTPPSLAWYSQESIDRGNRIWFQNIQSFAAGFGNSTL